VALSISSTGISVGGLVFTPLATVLIDHLGLGHALLWLGGVWFVVVLAAAGYVWPDPAGRGVRPDGDLVDASAPLTGGPAGVPYEEAIRSRYFRALVLAYVVGLTAQVGALIHLFNRVSDDTDKRAAGAAVLCVALASVVFRLIGGVVAERIPLARMTAVMFVFQAVSLVVLAAGSSVFVLLVGALIFGATVGNTLMLQPLLIAEAFGVRDYPRIYSLNMMLTTLGVAAGPFVVGVLHDAADGYAPAFYASAALSVVAAMTVASFPNASLGSATGVWATTK
jgi:MFS family permease